MHGGEVHDGDEEVVSPTYGPVDSTEGCNIEICAPAYLVRRKVWFGSLLARKSIIGAL